MIFRPFYRDDIGCAAYVFGCGTYGKGVVVDPRIDDIEAYAAFAASKGLQITHVIDTHVHADHLSGGRELGQMTGALYCLHESAEVMFPFTAMRDGQTIEFGNTRVSVLHTPGHSPESVCLAVADLRRGDAPWFLLTGDTLFVAAVGRPDLPGHARDDAAQLFTSLHDKVLSLPDEIEIYPAHFSGSVCGAGLSGKPASTLGFERRWNPALSFDQRQFVEAATKTLPMPTDMDRILAVNRGGDRSVVSRR